MGLAARKPAVVTRQNILLSLEGIVTPRVPFWLMRQAGRYLPEYRALRMKAGGFLDLCYNPTLAAEATLQPVRRFDTDAAILFSDILTVPQALGQDVTFEEGEGPRLGALPDIDGMEFNESKLTPVYETARRVRAALPEDKTLIGFAGAPWTVACYMIEGKGGGSFEQARRFALEHPQKFDALMAKLTQATAAHLIAQIRAGADAVQLFDSWAGLLPEPMFMKYVVAPAAKIVAALRAAAPGTPIIGFPRGAGAMYGAYAMKSGVDAVSLDTQACLGAVRRDIGPDTCLQGNLDPVVLLAGGAALENEARRILEFARAQPFIFNLGHGVIKDTPPAHVAQLAAIVRGFSR